MSTYSVGTSALVGVHGKRYRLGSRLRYKDTEDVACHSCHAYYFRNWERNWRSCRHERPTVEQVKALRKYSMVQAKRRILIIMRSSVATHKKPPDNLRRLRCSSKEESDLTVGTNVVESDMNMDKSHGFRRTGVRIEYCKGRSLTLGKKNQNTRSPAKRKHFSELPKTHYSSSGNFHVTHYQRWRFTMGYFSFASGVLY